METAMEPGARILIVDDDPGIRDVVSEFLDRHGYRVETAADGKQYVDAKFYDGTIFHRVIPSFMVQGGGFTPDMNEKDTRAPIQNESANGLSNLRGTLAMARTPDPHSASSQFFINLPSDQRNQFLDRAQARDGWGYCVFGKVIEGLDTIDKIAAVPTGNRGPHPNVPVEPVVIKSVRRG
jgi:cyclophilin family peptidyl-prolyl cis-trans isomerase